MLYAATFATVGIGIGGVLNCFLDPLFIYGGGHRPDHLPGLPGHRPSVQQAGGHRVKEGLFSTQVQEMQAVSEDSGMELDPEYDLFEEKNGFRKEGPSFPDEFIQRFQRRQGQRNNAILDHALDRLARLERGAGLYSDDEPLVIPGANQVFFNNKLYAQDTRLMSHTRQPRQLIHAGGSSTVEIVRSVRGPENPQSMTHSMADGARIMTVRNYLTSYTVRTLDDHGYGEDSVWGIDWDSTYSCPPGNVKHIRVPSLFMGMTAGWEFLAAETIYEMSASPDKTIAFVAGADHKFLPARGREGYPGQFGDTMELLHDYVARWLSAGCLDTAKG